MFGKFMVPNDDQAMVSLCTFFFSGKEIWNR